MSAKIKVAKPMDDIDDLLDDIATDVFVGKADAVEEPPDPVEYDPDAEEAKPWGKSFGSKKEEEVLAPQDSETIAPAEIEEKKKEETKKEETKKEIIEETEAILKSTAAIQPIKAPVGEKPIHFESGIVTIERSYHIPKEDEPTKYMTKTIKTPVTKFLSAPARVGVKYGLTMNLGNYESARVDVNIEIPCYKEDIDEVYRMASDYTESLINEHAESIREDISGGSAKAEEEKPW